MDEIAIGSDWLQPEWVVLEGMDLGLPVHAICFDLAGLKRRNCYFGPIYVDHEINFFHRTLCAQITGKNYLVFRIDGTTEWLAVTQSPDLERIVQGVTRAYVELTPMTVTYRFEGRLPDGQVRVGELTGAGVIERAFRCGVIRLQAGSNLKSQVDAARKQLEFLPLNMPVRLDVAGTGTGQKLLPLIQIETLSPVCCLFCGATIMEGEVAANRATRKTFFTPPVGPLYYGERPTPCPACPAFVQYCEEGL